MSEENHRFSYLRHGSNFTATATAHYNYVYCFYLLTLSSLDAVSIVSASQVWPNVHVVTIMISVHRNRL